MTEYEWQDRKRCERVNYLLCALVILIGLAVAARVHGGEASPPAGGEDSPVAQIRTAFDAAMAKPLRERIPLLETLEGQIDRCLSDDGLDPKTKAGILQYKYRIELGLAKFPESRETLLSYLDALEEGYGRAYSRLAFRRHIEALVQGEDWPEVLALSEAVKDHYPEENNTKAIALYYMGLSCMRMNGMMQRARDLFQTMVEECVDNPLRPWGLRMLANCNLSLGDMNACLGVLQIMKQQYVGTKWEHYADMRPAFVYEHQTGDTQKALQIYEETLQRYPNHFYWGYIEKEMARLRKVIEEQLIRDALEDIASNKTNKCGGEPARTIGFAILRNTALAMSHR